MALLAVNAHCGGGLLRAAVMVTAIVIVVVVIIIIVGLSGSGATNVASLGRREFTTHFLN
jgi:uncharacterized membrane protein